MHILWMVLLAYERRTAWLMKFVWVIPNANGGLHVGLGVEPTVSYSSEEKKENAYKCLLGFLEDIYYFTEEKDWI